MSKEKEFRSTDRSAISLWYSQTQAASDNPWLASILLRRSRRMQQRLAYYFARLSNLPRRWRRRIQRGMAAGLLGAALLLAMGGSPTVHAATISVGGGCTLRDAITAANTDTASGGCIAGVGADTIVLSGGTYTYTAEFVPGSGNALPAISSVITIEGNGSTISRSGTTDYFRVLYVGPDGDLTLNQVTISGGSSDDYGGGVYNRGNMTLNESIVSDNSTNWYGGGGLFNGGNMTLHDSMVSGNSAPRRGGGIFNSDSYYYDNATLTLYSSTVSGNSADSDGGGLYNSGNMTLNDSIVSGNTGSGIHNYEVTYYFHGATVTLNRSTVSGNNGAGIFNGSEYYGEATVTLNSSTVSGNTGIGIDNISDQGDSTLTLNDSTVSGNAGGGIDNYAYAGDTTLTLNNSTVSGNTGSGIHIFGYEWCWMDVMLNHATVTGNSAVGEGGGIYSREYDQCTVAVNLSQSLISGNMADIGSEIYFNTPHLNADSYNLIGHSGLTTAQAISGFTPGVSDITATSDGTDPTALSDILDPLLAGNGGPALTHALVPGSPAIDASPSGLAADQRGVTRPLDGDGDGNAAFDIGAVEMGAIFCDIQAATEQPTFDFGAMSVKITDVGSNLECVRSTNFPQNHPDAGDGTDTGQYWHIDGLQGDQLTPATVDYIFNLTLPHSADLPQDASVCKHVGDTNWVCDRTGADTNTVWLDDITDGFSDWTAGDNVPTAVSLVAFEAHAVSATGNLFAALLAAAGAAYLSLRRLVSR